MITSPRPPLSRLLGYLLLGIGACAPLVADEASATRRFDLAKGNEAQLIAFVKGMPKGADLHNHLTGAVYAETILDAAIKSDLYFDPGPCVFIRKAVPGAVPAKELLTNRPLAEKMLDVSSMRGWHPAQESGEAHFFGAWSHLEVPLGPTAAFVEILLRARSQNLQYLELMAPVAPGAARAAALANPPAVEDLDQALALMRPRFPALIAATRSNLDFQDSLLAQLTSEKAPITGGGGPVNCRYIFTVNRTLPNSDFFAAMACGMALVQADPRVVAVNILAPEDNTMARQNFDAQMKIIDFLWHRLGEPNLSLHAGELSLANSPVEVMNSRIRKSVELGHARRIGHGVSIAWEDNLPELLRELKSRHVAVEICLSSNEAILGISGDRHPFNLYRAAGVPMSLNTDDEGISRSNITMEFVRAIRSYNLSYQEVKTLVRNSLEYSFLPGPSLYADGDYAQLRPGFSDLRKPGWAPSPKVREQMAASGKAFDKLSMEVRLEQAFMAFEE